MRRVTWIPGITVKWCPNSLCVFLNEIPMNTRDPCLDLPGLACLNAYTLVPVSDCLLIAGNSLFPVGPRELSICESPCWTSGWELMEQPNSFLKIICHLLSPVGIYTALETKISELSLSVPLLAPRALGKVGWAWLEEASYKEPPHTSFKSHHPSPPWPCGHRIHLEQRAPCWSCRHQLIRAIFL